MLSFHALFITEFCFGQLPQMPANNYCSTSTHFQYRYLLAKSILFWVWPQPITMHEPDKQEWLGPCLPLEYIHYKIEKRWVKIICSLLCQKGLKHEELSPVTPPVVTIHENKSTPVSSELYKTMNIFSTPLCRESKPPHIPLGQVDDMCRRLSWHWLHNV